MSPQPIASPLLDDDKLRESLKRCSPATYYAACKFRHSRELRELPAIVTGVMERYVERELRPKLREGGETLRLREDLGLDSLTMMEVIMLAEEVLGIDASNEELQGLRTVGDVQTFVVTKVKTDESHGVPGSNLLSTPSRAAVS